MALPLPPSGQINTCKNITFLQFRLQAVMISFCPKLSGLRSPVWEILDPPLNLMDFFRNLANNITGLAPPPRDNPGSIPEQSNILNLHTLPIGGITASAS